ncbi:hypothetical protein BGZ65_013035, partial [Modicella reniformis]
SYRYVAKGLDKLMSRYYSKTTATLHCDGKPSLEKSGERSRRNDYLKKQIIKLEHEVQMASDSRRGSLKRAYKMCRQLYRAPATGSK